MAEFLTIHGSKLMKATLIPERRCENCTVSDEYGKFFCCGNCEWAMYCSQECQKNHWKEHKEHCTPRATRPTKYDPEVPGPADPEVNPDGLTMYMLEQNLARWKKYQTPKLMLATIHALGLHSDWARARTHALHVRIHARPKSEHKGQVGRFFRVVGAEAVPLVGGPWGDIDVGCAADEAAGRGASIAALLEFPEMALNVMPFGSIMKEHLVARTIDTWERILMEDILEGGTTTRLRM